MNVNYNFLVKLYSELNEQKIKFNKNLQGLSKFNNFKSRIVLAPRAGLEPATN